MVFVGRAFLVEEASSKAFGVGVCVMCFRNNEGVCSGWKAVDGVSIIGEEQITCRF